MKAKSFKNQTSSGKVSIWSHIRIAKLANPTYLRNNPLSICLERENMKDFPHICSHAVENRRWILAFAEMCNLWRLTYQIYRTRRQGLLGTCWQENNNGKTWGSTVNIIVEKEFLYFDKTCYHKADKDRGLIEWSRSIELGFDSEKGYSWQGYSRIDHLLELGRCVFGELE